MTPTLTAQQIGFFAKNGFLELEEVFTSAEWNTLISALSAHPSGRDLWRNIPSLQSLLLSRKLSGLLSSLSDEPSLRLACDHLFPADFSLARPAQLKDFLCIQGLSIAFFLSLAPLSKPEKTAPLGLLPFPAKPGNLLFLKPQLLLQWPPAAAPLYLVTYALPSAVYIHNPNDPAALFLKQFGYGYGDRLRTNTHPLLNLF
ncbi:MAG: hypothetical protein KGJ02_08360 [Verrucomicrobiota bacterium]|nr:hypothetical protein [Verrucomicrobiota bacterium]